MSRVFVVCCVVCCVSLERGGVWCVKKKKKGVWGVSHSFVACCVCSGGSVASEGKEVRKMMIEKLRTIEIYPCVILCLACAGVGIYDRSLELFAVGVAWGVLGGVLLWLGEVPE